MIHVSRSAICKWEMGKGIPSEPNIEGLCEFFNVTEESLLENEKSVELAVEFEKTLNSFNNMRSVLYVDGNKYASIFVDEDN